VCRLGRGGNGEVWLCRDEGGQEVAVKFLIKAKKIAYARFRDEVQVLREISKVEGILPLIDYDLPDLSGESAPWYAMPLGIPAEKWTATASPSDRVAAIADAADTMATLHESGIAHRDIKPANLLIFKDRCHIVDFGLVNYPHKSALTGYREQIGPLWTMAPEVRRNGTRADSLPADVFSMAKTLWILLTQRFQGFDGQYANGSEISIRRLFEGSFVSPLEDLLAAATAHNYRERPSMREFANGLRDWLKVSNDFLVANPLQWREVFNRLFPVGIPLQAIWTNPKEIVAVLNVIGQTPSLNHMFYPSGGGNDLIRARMSPHEEGCIELFAGLWSLVKPVSLSFEGFLDDQEWCYFRLETGTLMPCGVYEECPDRQTLSEAVTEIDYQTYVDYSCWVENCYNDTRLPGRTRPVTRWFAGAFVIVQKTSFYNLADGDLDAYSGRHNSMDAVTFRSHLEDLKKAAHRLEINLRCRKMEQRQAYLRSRASSSKTSDPW
jgi:serine/threonine-protein kinase